MEPNLHASISQAPKYITCKKAMSKTMSKTNLTTTSLCALISGGFVVSGSQCVVAIESKGKQECQMIAVESVTPEDPPEQLLEKLSNSLSEPSCNLTVTVYGICGGLHGKPK